MNRPLADVAEDNPSTFHGYLTYRFSRSILGSVISGYVPTRYDRPTEATAADGSYLKTYVQNGRSQRDALIVQSHPHRGHRFEIASMTHSFGAPFGVLYLFYTFRCGNPVDNALKETRYRVRTTFHGRTRACMSGGHRLGAV